MTALVNFSHLNRLTEKITFHGDPASIVHMHANHPSYEWAGAKESNPEGIACVDDAARAAIVYLRHYELTKEETSHRRARLLCTFVMKMQADDGRFYNFVFPNHSINKTGKTSYKSFGWWAIRAVWCLAAAYRTLKEKDPSFAKKCRSSLEAALPYVDVMLEPYNRMIYKSGLRMPQWLLYTTGADATSELLLGLIEYARASDDARVREQIQKIAEGLVMMQDGDWKRFPFALHRSWETLWHSWANGQTLALASAAYYLEMKDLVPSAELEAKCFYSRLIIHGMMKEIDAAKPDSRREFEQAAYCIRPAAIGLMRLYEATHDMMYLKMAGLMASWFFGNNSVGQVMFDAETGRCFDGILDAKRVNQNSGAESTIEALAVMVELSRFAACKKYLYYKRTDSYTMGGEEVGVFAHKDGSPGVFIIETEAKSLQFLEGKNAERYLKRFPVPVQRQSGRWNRKVVAAPRVRPGVEKEDTTLTI
jgi:hypothetical protein